MIGEPVAHRVGFLFLCVAVSLSTACGSASAPVGRSEARPDPRAIELALRTPAGDWIHIGDLRGRPVLLFLFATFDGISQAALRPLSRFTRRHGDVHVVGIASQPDASQLLDPYERALTPPFPLTYDPERNVNEGTSVLGAIEAVPTFIMFDASGVEVGRHVGFPNTGTLERLREDALSRGGLHEPGEAELMGITPR